MKKIVMILLIIYFILINSIVLANDTLVYIDSHNIDRDYHRLTCNFIPKEHESISVEEAFAEGYRSCPICEPAISDAEKKLKDEEYDERLEKAKEIVNSINTTSTTTSSNSVLNSSNEDVVYVTSKGSKYHLENCSFLDSSSQVHKIMLRTAINKGYIPCNECNPYGMADTTKNPNINMSFFIIIILFILLIIYIIINEKRYLRNKNK